MFSRSSVLILLFLFAAPAVAVESFVLPDLEGRQHKLSDYRGKWVVVNYWATWCPPCLAEIPDLIKFQNKFKDKDAVVLGVNFESIEIPRLRSFVGELAINYPVLLEPPGANGQFGYIPGLPVTYLVSPEGELIAKQVGMITGDLLERVIKAQKEKRRAL